MCVFIYGFILSIFKVVYRIVLFYEKRKMNIKVFFRFNDCYMVRILKENVSIY